MPFNRPKKQVSIIIPSWFTPDQHGKYGEHETFNIANTCLQRLIQVTPKDQYELIIIDNGSTLNDIRYYWETADILIRNKENLGFAPAINQGVNIANGDYVCAINNDVLLWSGWLDALLDVFKPGLGLPIPCGVSMPALLHDKSGFWEVLKIEKPDLKKNFGVLSPGAEFGSCFLAPRKILMEVAKFRDGYQVMDENFKLSFGEDRMLWVDIRRLGYETYRTHTVRIAHVGNLTIGKIKSIPENRKMIDDNRIYLAQKKKEYGIE